MPFKITKKKINNKFYYRVYCDVNDERIFVPNDSYYSYKIAKRNCDSWNNAERNIAKTSEFNCPVQDIDAYLAIHEYNLFMRLKEEKKKII